MKDNTTTRLIAVAFAVMAIGGVAVTGVVLADTQAGNDDTDAQQSSYLRVVHAAANAPAVDVAVDDETVVSNLAYSNVTDYQKLPAGNHTVTITAADNASQVLFDGAVYLEARAASTLAATTATQHGGMVEEPGGAATTPGMNETETPGMNETDTPMDNETEEPLLDNETETPGENGTATPSDGAAAPPGGSGDVAAIQPVMFIDNAWEPDEGSAALSAVHLAPDAPAVDVTVPLENASGAMDNGTATDTPMDNETATDTPMDNETEEPLLDNETETPAENGTMTDENATMAGENETMAGNASDGGMLVLADDLDYRSAADYESLPAGEHTIQIREAAPDNRGEIIKTVNVTVEAGTAHSALVLANATDTEMNATETPGMNETETPGMNETDTPMDNETEEPLLDNETETPAANETMTDENATMADENATMAGNDTQAAGDSASVMVEFTEDVTYTLHLPGESNASEGTAADGSTSEDGEAEQINENPQTTDEAATPTEEAGA